MMLQFANMLRFISRYVLHSER